MIDLRQNLVERRMIELDPDLAKHYLKFNTYVTQRPIRAPHVSDLANKMENGLFRFGEVAFVVNNGSRDLMVNGQHVCSAVIESGETVPCALEKFKVKNDRELSEIFRQFEILPRSLRDMVMVEANALGIKWPGWISSIVVTAAAMEVAGHKALISPSGMTMKNRTGWITKDDKVKLLGKYLKKGEFVAEILSFNGTTASSTPIPFMKRAAVILIMMRSWEKHQTDARKFWERVRDGENLTKTMPEMKLRNFLLLTRQKLNATSYL